MMTTTPSAAALAAAMLALPTAAPAQTSGMTMPMQPKTTQSAPANDATMPGMAMSSDDAMQGMGMMGDGVSVGGSGTSRLPADEGMMAGVHFHAGGWMLMAHGYLWGIYTDQGGPRGANEAFATSMAMLTADHDLGAAHLELRTMMSLEPAMGPRGYPDLFATGETADGTTPLIDRQHPHDLFMELSGRLDVPVGGGGHAFVYGGPVAEPALGPSAFMHRASAEFEPLAPITHHWFDSTHISYGVVTGGVAGAHWQLEGSAFRGREPDQHRWDIETPALDSWSVRASWMPSSAWVVEVSHGHLHSPEQLDPRTNEDRTIASVQYDTKRLATTLAMSAKNEEPGRTLTALLAEANWTLDRHDTVFARFENVDNDELFPDPASPLHGRAFRISKLEGGYAYRLPFVGPTSLAIGGAVGVYGKSDALSAAYGDFPVSLTVFAKWMLGKG